MDVMEYWRNDTARGKPKYLEKNLPQRHFAQKEAAE
jgi:hypothetical protein